MAYCLKFVFMTPMDFILDGFSFPLCKYGVNKAIRVFEFFSYLGSELLTQPVWSYLVNSRIPLAVLDHDKITCLFVLSYK